MARTLPPYDHLVEEDYIDLDISSITFLCYTISSPPHSRDFEFKVSTNTRDGEATTFPADELFHKGKLLPLHKPPRLQMVQKLLQSSTTLPQGEFPDALEEKTTTTPTTTTTSTPFETCNISHDTSCCVAGEMNSDNSRFQCSTGLVRSKPKKSWSKRLKLIGQYSALGLRLKASQAYLKSLFTKSACSDETCAVPKPKECSNGYVMARKKDSFGQIQRERYLVADTSSATLIRRPNEEEIGHRKSLSGIIKWNSTMKSSSCSSSSSFASAKLSGYYQPRTLKRSSSVNSEVESSIQGAIAYCKKSQQLACARKSASDVGYYSVSAPRIAAACEDQQRPGICRG
ncbi:putative membrane-associated kinase regulator 4 [Cocos nucifera]|uniref:Putative membrane-associated kinase regulator 4 n=1 Tax=Cocos nucifera TaxID=13894 RepID=A0A8K0IZM1_COCNU|nr:putative membrane-associated kinase regulator 4 [Cocos nucifera]